MSSLAENEYAPEEVSPPGDTLAETLEAKGMSQAELAERTGRPKKTINEIINGKASITSETALQLERVLGVPARFWIERESQYQESLARRDERARLAHDRDWVRSFPIKEMARAGWIRAVSDPVDQLRELLNFFGIASPRQWDAGATAEVSFRRSSKFEIDRHATRAWLRQGEIEASTIPCEPFDEAAFKRAIQHARKLSRLPHAEGVKELRRSFALVGVAVVIVPEIDGIRASGASRWLSPAKAMIVLSYRYKKDDHFWFSLFHESAHVLLHPKSTTFIDVEEGGLNPKEREADEFARNVLIPADVYQDFLDTRPLTEASVVAFAEELGIAPGIVVGRLQHDDVIDHSHFNRLKVRLGQ
ncbi:MAG: HigA family addiction module antidote protein [Deltaproteobacteria bacterium]|nr:HigA family addiction module antidote protein [Deltaproteobacteria bacterium]